MKKSYFGLLGLALASALTAPANAADIYRDGASSLKDAGIIPVSSWTGFYAGVHMGGASGDLNVFDRDVFRHTFNNDADDIFVGGQLGYNVQLNSFVAGIEADFGGIAFSNATFEPGSSGAVKSTIDRGLYGDVTGRLGYAFDRTLVYAKGGIAFYEGEIAVTENNRAAAKADSWTGWTVGGGVERKFAPNWSVKAEYQYFDFGSEEVKTSANDRFRNELTAHTAKIGVNYLFTPSYEPLK